MKRFSLIFTVVMVLAACGDQSGNKSGTENGNDSTSTAPITDPSYNPKVEADSAAKQMNLDSTLQKDSGDATLKAPGNGAIDSDETSAR